MLKSRTKYDREKFVNEFLNTIRPGIIKRENFIDWNLIKTKLVEYKEEINFFEELISKNKKLPYIRDSLLSADDPTKILSFIFNLLGHTQTDFVSWEDCINLKQLANNFKTENMTSVNNFIEMLSKVGFENILNEQNIHEVYLGILIGLESHRRKNVGGTAYVDYIEPLLNRILKEINNPNLRLEKEYVIKYAGDSLQTKTVDFAIFEKNILKIGIEVNFYTNTGSKPTEIKRSYGEVNRKLNEKGIELVWITDGFGYTKMNKSLGDAFEIHKNTYNTEMIINSFKNDIIDFLKL